MISHDNYTFVTDAVIPQIGLSEDMGKIRLLSLLPLSHVAAQLVDLVIAVRVGANVFFTDPSALQGNLVKFLLVARPYFQNNVEPFLSLYPEYGKRFSRD